MMLNSTVLFKEKNLHIRCKNNFTSKLFCDKYTSVVKPSLTMAEGTCNGPEHLERQI